MINLTRSKKEMVLTCECGLEHHITKENNKVYLETVYKKTNVSNLDEENISDEEIEKIPDEEIEIKQDEEKKENKKSEKENLFDW